MLVAISQRRGQEYGGADILESTYVDYFSDRDVQLIPIPNRSENVEHYFHKLQIQGLILSGGGGVHPQFYDGEAKSSEVYSLERDNTERALLDLAIRAGLPILGICRGMQAINVYFGGKLIQNIEGEVENAISHVRTKHRIDILDDLVRKAINSEVSEVNSYHNSGISESTLSRELLPFAFAEDQTIEGIYHPRLRLAAVMWHPERVQSKHLLNSILIDAFKSEELFWRRQK